MTRQEFLDDVVTVEEFINFCEEYDLTDWAPTILTFSDMSEEIETYLRDLVYDYGWEEVRDRLNNYPTDDSIYYVRDKYDHYEYHPLYEDRDLDDIKNDLLNTIDEEDFRIFDDDVKIDDEEGYMPEREEEEDPRETFSILFCN